MKRPTDQQLRERLMQPGPKRQGRPVDAVTPPDQEMAVWVTLDMLKPYEHNPRQVQNPKYEEIKASIRAAGLLQDLDPAAAAARLSGYLIGQEIQKIVLLLTLQ